MVSQFGVVDDIFDIHVVELLVLTILYCPVRHMCLHSFSPLLSFL